MLKNKNAIYILIPLNIAVWGFFIYRFYAAYHTTGPELTEARVQAARPDVEKDSATYHLALSYKDPFLKERNENYKAQQTHIVSTDLKKQNIRAAITTAIIKEAPPDIKYLGLVKNARSGTTTALVLVNGRSRLVKPNETIDGFLFKSFSRDSLVAKHGKEKIIVLK